MMQQSLPPQGLKGPFQFQHGQKQIQRIEIMAKYTPKEFQKTVLKVLKQLLEQFKYYDKRELIYVQAQLQKQIKIRQAIQMESIGGMSTTQINNKITDLKRLYAKFKDSRLKRKLQILEDHMRRVFQMYKFSNSGDHKAKKNNQGKFVGFVESLLGCLPILSQYLPESIPKVDRLDEKRSLEQQQSFLSQSQQGIARKDKDKTE